MVAAHHLKRYFVGKQFHRPVDKAVEQLLLAVHVAHHIAVKQHEITPIFSHFAQHIAQPGRVAVYVIDNTETHLAGIYTACRESQRLTAVDISSRHPSVNNVVGLLVNNLMRINPVTVCFTAFQPF